jgi:hypothetical protein
MASFVEHPKYDLCTPYPTMNIDSIICQYNKDVADFKSVNPSVNTIVMGELDKAAGSVDGMKIKITEIINNIYKDNTEPIVDYPTLIKTLTDTKNQNTAWLYRTQLLFQICVYASMCMETKSFYDAVSTATATTATAFTRTYNSDINTKKGEFNLGIFGSKNASSDIDIGITFGNAKTQKFVAGIAYIVALLEDLFIVCTRNSSLYFDIEFYGNALTIPNKKYVKDSTDYDKMSPDVYYFNMSDFDFNDIVSLNDMVWACLLRGYVFSAHTPEDRKKLLKNVIENPQLLLNKIYENWDTIIAKVEPTDAITKNFKITQTYAVIDQKQVFGTVVKNLKILLKTLFDLAVTSKYFEIDNTLATKYLYDYVNSEYAKNRETYYTLLQDGDIHRKPYFEKYMQNYNNKDNASHVKGDVIDFVRNEGVALIMREESYIFTPSVLHVVRYIQAEKSKDVGFVEENTDELVLEQKYCKGNYGKEPVLRPLCGLNEFGYALSCIEQFSYLLRFHLHYCVNNGSENTACDKKMKKYGERFVDGIYRINEFSNYFHIDRSDKTYGGRKTRRKQTRRNKKQHRRSKRTRK